MNGQRLSHYELLDEISRGGMGVVYRAVDLNLGREVAIKVLPDAIVHDPGRRARLLQEARAAATLEHPHVAVIHEAGDAEGVTFIAMELIRGEKLSDQIARGPLPLARALVLATEIAEGLARAHEKALVHRDLKPANVMVTDEGHAKIIDFGLAKLVDTAGAEGATVSVAAPRTDAGLVLGTAAYMSPEQARGLRVDHRTDVFSFGVTLYEMLTARRAFHGQSTLDTMQAVLTQAVPPLPASAETPSEATAEIQRVIAKCTEKDPDDRYQSMKDLTVDLRAARRRLESLTSVTPRSGVASAAPPQRSRRVPAVLVTAGVVVIVAAAAFVWWKPRGTVAPSAPSGRQAVAVLYFENNTGDASLDWMRTGLTDMLVTDLSQSPEFEVVGTDQVVQILSDMRRADDRLLSADVVQAVASRAHVDNVVLGSYVKAGDTIRISARLQDARTGRIVKAERVEGPGQSGVFQLVDELTRRLKATIAPPAGASAGTLLTRPGMPAEAGLDRGVTEITTSSIEAYRYYAEGLNFHERGLSAQAVPLLERAIQIDPDFAMALAKLAVVNWNLRLMTKSEDYARRAVAHVDRLNTRERYYIEGFYYGLRIDTRAKSIEAYKQELALHPEHQASRHNLALAYFDLERFDEGIRESEELLRRGASSPTSYENLADAFIRVGNTSRARQVADELVARQPDNAISFRVLGSTLVAEGRLDDARAAFDKSVALDPLAIASMVGRENVAILQERWADAEAVNEQFARSAGPVQQFIGLRGAAQILALRGHGQAAVASIERASRMSGLSPIQRAVARNLIAQLLLRQGNAGAAVSAAQQALADARGLDAEFESLRLLCAAQAAAGQRPDSDKTLALLESRSTIVPSDREKRRVLWARGLRSLAGRDTATAASLLTQAATMLPAHGTALGGPVALVTDLWYDVAWADVKAGRDKDAAPWLERLQSGFERAYGPDAYARSFFVLGQIYERAGDTARAQQQYARFVELWGDGDSERGWVEEARKKVQRR